VVLTYLNVVSAMVGMYLALVHRDIYWAIICLMFSGVCDMFDGAVANRKERTEREMNFGIQIDALSDIISFGAFPAVIGYALFSGAETRGEIIFYIAAFAIYVLAALIRLGYFNVLEMETLGKDERNAYFEGLPVTTIALLVPLYYVLYLIFNFSLLAFYPVILLITAAFFIFRIKVPKPRGIRKVLVGLTGIILLILIIILG
jgi:CDP-diacylglycerol--serine O-phosphatidyltransferase